MPKTISPSDRTTGRSRQSDCNAVLSAPFGAVAVRMRAGRLVGLQLLPDGTPLLRGGAEVAAVAAELRAYFADPDHRFSLAFDLAGTPFRRRVWQALLAIPPGETRTYGEIAKRLGTSPRSVGQALGDNPIPIVVPCHRVLSAGGIGGFMHSEDSFPLDTKRWLLRHEGVEL